MSEPGRSVQDGLGFSRRWSRGHHWMGIAAMTIEIDTTKSGLPAIERTDDAHSDADSAARREKERQLDDALANTFPASDPVSVS
jgi:hypothetical protein